MLDDRRQHERGKYVRLASEQPDYGSSNHGSGAVPHIAGLRPGYVVDFGCGRNNLVRQLRDLGIAGCGVDFVFPEADVSAPMHDTMLPSALADVVTSFDAMEHLLPDEVGDVLREMRRVAAHRGRFVFSICTRPSVITVDGENLHPTVRPMAWWREMIAEVGSIDVPGDLPDRYLAGAFR